MKIINNIFTFFKSIFSKKDNAKMLEATSDEQINVIEHENNFKESLKDNVVKKKGKKVETLICVGDGLGIQNKISY